jgi:MFS family permease
LQVTYYAPTLFKSSLGMSEQMALLMGCLLQLWYILASFVTWYTIDRVGRRLLLISMAIGMCVVLVAEAICVAINNAGAAIGAVFFVFAFEACFTWGWMGCVWVYPPEILPLKIRAKGAALAAAADFLGNFLVVEITPPALQNIGYRTYIIFAVLNAANAIIVWCFYPETGGQPLEAIDRLFVEDGQVDTSGRHFLRKLQWDVVPRAAEQRRAYRRKGFMLHEEDSKASDEQVEA